MTSGCCADRWYSHPASFSVSAWRDGHATEFVARGRHMFRNKYCWKPDVYLWQTRFVCANAAMSIASSIYTLLRYDSVSFVVDETNHRVLQRHWISMCFKLDDEMLYFFLFEYCWWIDKYRYTMLRRHRNGPILRSLYMAVHVHHWKSKSIPPFLKPSICSLDAQSQSHTEYDLSSQQFSMISPSFRR